MIKYLKNGDDFEVLTKEKVLVDFYADWCGPCHVTSEILENLNINILKVDIDEFDEIALKYNVNAIPTLVLFENSQEVKRIVGVCEKQEILDFYN